MANQESAAVTDGQMDRCREQLESSAVLSIQEDMTNRLVSVLIPAFNAERWIAEAIASVHAQTYRPLEIVVVDDGSTDRTATIARGAAATVIQQENKGAGAARNRAIEASRGDYFQWLDADDLLAPQKIERSIRMVERAGGATAATCRWGRFRSDPREVELGRLESFESPLDVILRDLHGESMQPSSTWLVPRGVTERAGPWHEYRSAIDDAEYFTRILLQCSHVAYDAEVLMYYRAETGGLSRVSTQADVMGVFRSIESMTAQLLRVDNTERSRCAAAGRWQRFAYDFYAHAPRIARDALVRAKALGGCPHVRPTGSPRFHQLARLTGWRLARRVERLHRKLFRTGAGNSVVGQRS